MPKTSAFITEGLANVRPVLEAVSSAADAFPPLKSAAGGALYILDAYKDFKSNQDEWKAFGEYVAQAIACVNVVVSQSGNLGQFDQASNSLARIMRDIDTDVKLQASMRGFRRFTNFLKDRNRVPALETKLNRALSNFNLGATVEDRNERAKALADIERLVRKISVIASKMENIDETSALRQLTVAKDSSWNSLKVCQQGTRLDILAELVEFASARDASSAERVLLLTGVAGCGKTAIAQSLAEQLSIHSWPSPRLGACFNFSVQAEDRRTPKLLFSTIAVALCDTDDGVKTSIVDALSSNRTLPSAPLAGQFDGLIRVPLSTLPNPPPHPTVLILDALDEITDQDGLEDLLKLLANEFSRLPAVCRVIITSRPDPTIIHWLESVAKPHVVRRQIEHKDSASLNDLRLVAQTRLREIASGRDLGDSWPGRELEEKLVQKAGGLFVWLDVACKAVYKSPRPIKELHRLLAVDDVESGMAQLYSRILDACPWDRRIFSSNYSLVLGTVIALKTPLSASAITQLIGSLLKADGDVENVLEHLAPVILGVSTLAPHSSPSHQVEISHESFREFVTADVSEDKRKYAIDETESSCCLALQCLRVLNDELPTYAEVLWVLFPNTEEGSNIPSPANGVISEAFGYACDYWMMHLLAVTAPVPELRPANVDIDFASEVDLNRLDRCLRSVHDGLGYMERLEEALLACDLSVQVQRLLLDRDPSLSSEFLAQCLNTLSNRLADLGQLEEALEKIEEAVRIRRQLAAQRPTELNSDLVVSLNILSNRHSELGRREEALTAVDEAVIICRRLVAERPDAFSSELAVSLNNLSGHLSGLGRSEEALTAIEEAVEIRRQLAAERPAAFDPALAMSLVNLSSLLVDLGRQEEGLIVGEEAVNIYRRLAASRPAAFNAMLATSLVNSSSRLAESGRREEALNAVQEAVKIRRQLADNRPAAFNPGLAKSLINLSVRLSDFGRFAQALNASEEAIKIYRQLASAHPAAFNPALATCLNNLSNYLAAAGRGEEALDAAEEAVRIYRGLAGDHPDAFSFVLSSAVGTLSHRFAELGRRDEALDAIQEAINIHRRLADSRPAAFNPVLATSYINLSKRLAVVGRREEALNAIETAVKICRQLAKERPAAFNADLATSLDTASGRFLEAGRREEALDAAEEAVGINRQLADDQPVAFNPDLARSLNNLSDRLAELGRREDAVNAVQEAIGIYHQLAVDRPADFNRSLATALVNLSVYLSHLGQREQALVAIEEAVLLYRRVPSEFPANFKPNLADALQQQAACLSAMGRDVEAGRVDAERAGII